MAWRRAPAWSAAAVILGLSLWQAGCAHVKPLAPGEALTKRGLGFDEWVDCTYESKKPASGRSPKFACETTAGQSLKVKYGKDNAEVFGEVLSTRLFWALGFAADRMYPVRVRCTGCPADPLHDAKVSAAVVVFDPATIERKLPGRAMETKPDSGWQWSELEEIGPDAPAGAAAQRDALKLLAAFVQHTDSKSSNQRLLCPKAEQAGRSGCASPVLMVNDLGLTFGQAGLRNRNVDSVSLVTWAALPVWRDAERCVARIDHSFTGSLSDPPISEAGRAFLAGLMLQLSDTQIRALFETARVDQRPGDPHTTGPMAGIDAWVTAFKLKRGQIVDARCPAL
jgi:hypothetical protein